MDVKSILKLDMTLQKLAAIASAVNLWELQAVRSKISTFRQFEMFNTELKKFHSDGTIRVDWKRLIIPEVEEAIDSLGLPAKLIEDIRCHVFEIGGVIFDFIMYLSKVGSEVDFGSKIHWASYGRMDLVRMVKEWSEGLRGYHFLPYRFLRLGGIYSEKDFARLCSMKKIKEVSEISLTSSPKDMLLFCLINKEFIFEARYFWHQLDAAEKEDIVYKCVEKCLPNCHDMTLMRYIRQVRTDLLLFFLSEMSDVQRLKFVKQRPLTLFKQFLETWPHQELCLNIVDNLEDFEFSLPDLLELLSLVIGYLNPRFYDSDDDLKTISPMSYINNNVFHAILQKLLGKIPKEVKLRYFTKTEHLFNSLQLFYDYRTLSIIFNDVDVKQIKQEKLFRIKFEKTFEHCISHGKFDFLQKYMKYVLRDKEDIELFKQKLNWISKYTCKGDIIVADNLLNLLYPAKCERDEVKEKVSVIFVASFVMEKRFKAADDFLKWRLDTEEKRIRVKKMVAYVRHDRTCRTLSLFYPK